MQIIDISHTISPELEIFPADPITEFTISCTINDSCPVEVTQIQLSSHVGTHIDAPSHYIKKGKTIDQLSLEPFIGRCNVIDLSFLDIDLIEVHHLKDIHLQPRVLFKTKLRKREESTAISKECIVYLATHNVILVGINSLSIDPFFSKSLDAHHTCFQKNIQIVENLCLNDVKGGVYTFIGLPLKFKKLDASPIRAVLISDDSFIFDNEGKE